MGTDDGKRCLTVVIAPEYRESPLAERSRPCRPADTRLGSIPSIELNDSFCRDFYVRLSRSTGSGVLGSTQLVVQESCKGCGVLYSPVAGSL